jgi:hypothetical protein
LGTPSSRAATTSPTLGDVALWGRVWRQSPTVERDPACGSRGRSGAGAGYAVANLPRSVFVNRDCFPFLAISRRIAE